jgi:uncharacterized protein (TIGR03435 family)
MKRHRMGKLGIAALTPLLVLGIASVPFLHAQSANSDWEKAAGGKMSFDVVSIRLNTSGNSARPNFPLDNSDVYSPNGGLLSATDFPVRAYITFAYKMSLGQQLFLAPQLPKWASQDKFDIQARAAAANPTKDQMRLMMQSLLADRFKLTVHWEKKDMPVYTLAVASGGFKLKFSDPQYPATNSSSAVCPVDDAACRRMIVGSIPVADFAGYLGAMVGRPVINKTGLTGTYDMNLMWSSDTAPNSSLPSLPTALRDQFGLELKSEKASVDVLMIDHLEEPSPN